MPLMALMAASLLGTACQRQVLPKSAIDTYPSPDEELDYLQAVEAMSAVTNNDALHGLLVLADGTDAQTSYDGRLKEAVARGWLPSGFRGAANESAAVGWMAVAGCQICSVKGGLTMHVLGPSPRYCTRELIYMDVIPLRTENQSLSGGEFTDYLNRLQRLRSGRNPMKYESELGTPAGEAASTPINEAAVEEAMPSPTEGAAPKGGEPAPPGGGL